jgi:hypothetical protein
MSRRRQLPHAELLEQPVTLPPGHPEGYTTFADPTDEALAELHDRLWPDEEWIDVEVCPWIDLIPHETWKAARKALRRGRSWRDGEVRYLVYRVHPCECGFWHVGPWWMRRRR